MRYHPPGVVALTGLATLLGSLFLSTHTVGAATRLGTDVVPRFQSVELRLDADEDDYTGSTRIELEVRAATDRFRLHAEDMTRQVLRLTGPDGNVALTFEMLDGNIIEVTTRKPLTAGEAYTLDIEFSSPFNTQAIGLYRMEHGGAGYAFTQFEPDDARLAFPCWDEPSFKIPFQLTVTVPEHHIAVSNTPVEAETLADGWRTFRFATTPPLPSYLIALATGTLETVPMPGLGVPGRVVTVKGQSHLAGLAVEMAPPILHALETWFGRKYPYKKLDFIAIPEYWPGAMENPGAVTYADRILLVDPDAATIGARRRLASVIAHELAHMWFGDLVTMEWWDDLWLNESFADWMGDQIAHETFPSFRLDLSTLRAAQNIMSSDARPSTVPIRRPVESTDNLLQDVGLAYSKGKTVLNMFEAWVGPETFRRGVLAYIEANAWGNAEAQDLWGALDEASGKDLSTALASYIEQPGFPLITIAAVEEGKVRIRQERFRNDGVESDNLVWKTPILLKYAGPDGIHTQSVMLDKQTQIVQLEGVSAPAWIYPNAGGSGYYRWSAPPDMLRLMSEEATAVLSAGERIEFLGNISALLDAGNIDGETYLATLKGFASDDEPLVASSLLGELGAVEMAFIPSELEGAFAAYVSETLGPALALVGMEPRPGEDETVGLLRPQLLNWLGAKAGDKKVLSFAATRTRAYLENPESLDPSLVGVVLRLAARQGDAALFDAFRRRFEAAAVPADRGRYLAALGSFQEEKLIKKALAYTLEGDLRANELFTIPGTVSGSPGGRDRIYQWTKENFDAIAKRLPPQFISFLPFVAGGCSSERLADARTFFSEPSRVAAGTESRLQRVAEQVEDCVRLRAREGAAVATYMSSFGSHLQQASSTATREE